VQETEVGGWDDIVVSVEQYSKVTQAGKEAQIVALVRDIVQALMASKPPLAVKLTESFSKNEGPMNTSVASDHLKISTTYLVGAVSGYFSAMKVPFICFKKNKNKFLLRYSPRMW
jgi:hypothetical protein